MRLGPHVRTGPHARGFVNAQASALGGALTRVTNLALAPPARELRNERWSTSHLTEQQERMREMAHDFAEQEIRPVAWEYDRDGTWPKAIIDQAWELGLMNSHLPERYGGTGVSYLEGCLIAEELAWGCAAIATTLGANDLATAPVLLGGPSRSRAPTWDASEEPRLASFCLTEPDAGSDVSTCARPR